MTVSRLVPIVFGLWIVALVPAQARGGGKPGPTPPPPTYPAARYWHNVTGNGSASPATSRVYMQGGDDSRNDTQYLNDLWYYRVDTGQWTLLSPSGRTWPQLGRGNGSITCGDGKCLLFGGTSGTKALNETWYFSEPSGTGTTVGWSRVSCKNPASCPPARYLHTMAFDPVRHYHVLFGGYRNSDGPVTFGDTWTFDGAGWTLRASSSSMPARSQASMTFVPSHVSNGTTITFDMAVAFGGDPYPNAPYPAGLCDLWAWNGDAWEAITAPDPKPCLTGAAMAWDKPESSSPRLVVAGGYVGGTGSWNTDTWYFTFTGDRSGTWSRASTTVCAPIREARGAYDASSRKFVFFGGMDPAGNAYDQTLVCP